MFNLNLLKNILVPLHLFIYLIFPNSAITQTTKNNFKTSLENALNTRNLELIQEIFKYDSKLKVPTKFAEIIEEFPDSKWKIKRLKSNISNKEIYKIKVTGKKIVNDDVYTLESNFNYLFTTLNGEIYTGSCIVFNSEGEMVSMLSFKNGKPGGIHMGYYPDGSLEYEGSRKNGEIHGKYIKYYFGGQTEMTGQFKRGIYNGKWKYYDVNGNLSMEKKYIRGSLIDSITY